MVSADGMARSGVVVVSGSVSDLAQVVFAVLAFVVSLGCVCCTVLRPWFVPWLSAVLAVAARLQAAGEDGFSSSGVYA